MNRFHRSYCRSGHWRRTLQEGLLPWALADLELGGDVLEIGPGPGLATDALERIAPKLTAIEVDPDLADSLARRKRTSAVRVVEGDGTRMPFDDRRFSGAVCFTMLHHVPSPELQDRLLAEVHRVLAPGALFAGSDSTVNWLFRLVHLGDTLVPIDPEGFGARLEDAGFHEVEVRRGRGAFRFRARS